MKRFGVFRSPLKALLRHRSFFADFFLRFLRIIVPAFDSVLCSSAFIVYIARNLLFCREKLEKSWTQVNIFSHKAEITEKYFSEMFPWINFEDSLSVAIDIEPHAPLVGSPQMHEENPRRCF
jgi:hypothetical protein